MATKIIIKKILGFLLLVTADFLAVVLSFFLAFLIRNEALTAFFPSLLQRPTFFSLYLTKFYLFAFWMGVFLYEKLYTKRFSFWDETRLILKSTSISFGFIMILVFVTQEYFYYSRLIILVAWALSLVLLPFFRYLTKLALIKLSFWKKKVIIIGTLKECTKLINDINKNKTLGYEIVGFLSNNRAELGHSLLGVKVLGHLDEIEKLKATTHFDDIIVALSHIPREKMITLLKRWEQISDTIRYIPRTGDLITTGIEIENIGKTLALTVRKNLHKPWNLALKFAVDFFLALILLVIFVPFGLFIAVAIKIDSPGPIFFVQERIGKRGRKIRVIKFRTMFTDAEKRLATYLAQNPQARQEWEEFRKLRSFDPRVTRVGRFLRRRSLDEVPQVINVLKGEMSLVGPRPYLPEEWRAFTPFQSIIQQVRPGITGLWQTSGRSNVSFKDRLAIDEYYIRNWSLWMDIVILFKTVKVSLHGEGAF